MIRPKVPVNPTPSGLSTPPAVIQPTSITPGAPTPPPAPMAPAPTPSRPTVQLTPGAVVAVAGMGTAVVLVVGAVLVSMLLAVAVTGASVAVCALVVRSILSTDTRR
ncbi:SpdD-like protein [Streptomyces sp. A2-16]|uniref:SpdD-like protein n=1 Tax=Streptomyces sp. A2-16 TaxID=2781734 RepID=UPI001BAEB58D|nr:SpdD-like protein [Streptomyces sp. A2-16]QUC62066.1 SpdD-like protein [Streptomyces sp. A2-16]